jgi:hypothetical protein
MNRPLLAAALCLAGTGLAACHDDEDGRHRRGHDGGSIRYSIGDGAIDLDGDHVVIVAGGQSKPATVGPDGSLRIGGEPVEIRPEGRTALRDYDTAAVAFKTHAIAIGRTGAAFGVDVLEDVVRGLFEGDIDAVGDRARDGARDLVANVRDLCQRLDAVHRAQQAAAAEVPAFLPYAVLDAGQVRACFEEADAREGERDDDKAPAPVPAATPAA